MCRPGDGPIYVGVPPLFLGTRLFPFPDLWRDVIVVAVHRLAIFPCCYDRTPGDIGVMTLNTTNCNTGTSPSSSAGRCRASVSRSRDGCWPSTVHLRAKIRLQISRRTGLIGCGHLQGPLPPAHRRVGI